MRQLKPLFIAAKIDERVGSAIAEVKGAEADGCSDITKSRKSMKHRLNRTNSQGSPAEFPKDCLYLQEELSHMQKKAPEV